MIRTQQSAMDKVRLTLVHFFSLTTTALIISSCASISMPIGGEKDIKKPKVLYTNPAQQSLNFKGRKIVLGFDEKIDVSKLKDKILITPFYPGEFDVSSSGNKVIIKLLDTLKKDKTYTINFQDGLKDIHEGNTIANYKLVFSTGDRIDSLSINGSIINAFTKNPQKNFLVGLYPITDTANPEKKKPAYFAYTNESGAYILSNIREDKYEIYAFNDINKDLLLNIKEEDIGYQIDAVNPAKVSDSLKLEVTRNNVFKPKLLNNKNAEENILIFNKGIFNYTIASEEKLYHELAENKKEIIIYKTRLCEDSLEIDVHVNDSSYNDTSFTTKIVRSAPKKFKTFKDILKSVEPDNKYLITDSLPIKIQFNYPIVTEIDSSIVIASDSVSFKYIRLLRDFKANSSNTIFTYTYKRRPKQYLNLYIKNGSLLSSIGDTNTSVNNKYNLFVAKKQEEEPSYAKINIKTNEKNFIIHLLNPKKEIQETFYNEKRLVFKDLKPGKYSMRLIADVNGDKKWDTGNYRTKTLPERITIYKDFLDVRVNWDIEDVDIEF